MKVKIPHTYDDITLGDFVKYHACKSDIEKVMLITGASKATIESWQVATIETIINEYEEALTRGIPKMDYIIEGERPLGFIPDIDAITLREHIDLDSFAQAVWKDKDAIDYTHLSDVMAILYRPIAHRFGKWYELEPYNVDKVKYYRDDINRIKMPSVNGALVFFSTILSELVENSLRFLEEEKKKAMTELEAMT